MILISSYPPSPTPPPAPSKHPPCPCSSQAAHLVWQWHIEREPPSCKKTDSPLLFMACYHGNTSINHTSQLWPDPRFLPGSRAAKMKPFQFTCWHTLSLSLSFRLLTISQVLTQTKITCTNPNVHKQTRGVRMPAEAIKHKHICMYVPALKKTQFCHFQQMTLPTRYASQ